MSNMTAAHKARADKVLSQRVRMEDGEIITRREMVVRLASTGAKLGISFEPTRKYNKRAAMRMDNKQQAAYEKAIADSAKDVYKLYLGGGSRACIVVTKIEADYFVDIGGAKI